MAENNTGTLLLKLEYKVDAQDHTVTLSHPSLSGVLGFEFTTVSLAHIQLNSLREDKEKTVIEGLAEDTVALMSAFKDLKDTVKSFR